MKHLEEAVKAAEQFLNEKADTFISGKDDMAWLYSTHLKGEEPIGKSAVITGNEDAPESIAVFKDEVPAVDTDPDVVYDMQEDGTYLKVS